MSSWKQVQVPPAVAWLIIAAIVVVAIVVIWRYTGGPGRTGMTEEQRRQMEQMFGDRPPGPTSAPAPTGPGTPAPTAPPTR